MSDLDTLAATAARLRLPVADLSRVSPRAVQLVAERWARRYGVLPLAATDSRHEVATANPLDLDCERALAFATGRAVRFSIADAADIARRLDDVYRPDRAGERGDLTEPAIDIQHLGADVEVDSPSSRSDDDPETVTRLVDQILADAQCPVLVIG
jgi:type II secretory ATPase GspE/PulE/Tfp pilus assembly ATPase PilB-like protein